MGLLKRRPKATAEIRLDNEARKTGWTTDDTIEGSAHFHALPETRINRVLVSLKGAITTKTNDSTPGSLQPSWRVERLKFLSVGKETQFDAGGRTGEGEVAIPFAFDLQECLRHSTLETGLPPSLNSKSEGLDSKGLYGHDSKAAYDTTYSISASAFSNRGDLLASQSQDVLLVSTGQSEPPSYGSAEVAGEYFTAKSDAPRSRLSFTKRSGLQADVAGQEPGPLVLQPENDGPHPTTTVNLILKLSTPDSTPPSNLPQQAHIRTQLLQRTRISPDGPNLLRTGRNPLRESPSQLLTSKRNAQDCTLAIPHWETVQPTADGATPGFALARLSFLYRHPQRERVAPTFTTPLLSRSYALEVKVSFAEDVGGQSPKVALPVPVVYEAEKEAGVVGVDDSPLGGRKESMASEARSCVSEIPQLA